MKIVGNGLIGRAFREVAGRYKDIKVTIFASGVAKSAEKRSEEYAREADMIGKEISMGNKIIYFSTCSILQKHATDYIAHKRGIEKILIESSECLIVRLPQVVGKNPNQNTVVEFFYRSLMAGNHFDIYANAHRSLIDVEDVVRIVLIALNADYHVGNVINISSGYQVLAIEIVRWFEKNLGIKGNYNIIRSNVEELAVDLTLAKSLLGEADIIFESHYWKNVLKKYYSRDSI